MIKRVKKWWQDREARIRQEMYFSGFGWAMASYYVDGWTEEQIENQLIHDYNSEFDNGAVAALKTLANIHGEETDVH